MIHDPIGRHLDQRAREIHLPRTDVAVIAERAAARRARRRRVTVGAAAAVLLTGGVVAVAIDGDQGRTPVATGPDAVVESPLEWTVVDPAAGLGQSRLATPVVGGDGALYMLSTQPGPAALTSESWLPRSLYRSADGTDWEPLPLPEGIHATSLAADGGRLYAVGTGPVAGDRIPLRLATSDDGGTTWSDPLDLPALTGLAEHGAEIVYGDATVAVHGGTTVVAVTAHAVLDIEDRVPAGIATDWGWEVTDDGVHVYGPPPRCAGAADVAIGRGGAKPATEGACPPAPVVAALTWEQLGVEPDLAALLTPHLYLFASDAGGDLTEVAPPVAKAQSPTSVVATDGGFTLVAQRAGGSSPGAMAFASTDGVTWTEAADLPGFGVADVGVVGDRVLVSGVAIGSGDTTVHVLGPDGLAASLDPEAALEGVTDPAVSLWDLDGFGPMGWAAVAYPGVEDGTAYVVHTDRAAQRLSAVPVPEELEAWGSPVGVTVTADAIIVRYTKTPDGDPSTVEPQRLLVGTPPG